MTAVLEQLAQALAPIIEQQKARSYGLGEVFKHDTSGTPGNVYSHGPGGNLTWPGVDPALFNATMGAQSLLSQLPAVPSVYTNPTYFTITGVQGDTGSEMSGVCDNAPTAGLMKSCLVTSVFGRYERATPLIDVGRLGARNDRADPLDLRLVNSPMSSNLPFGLGGGIGDPPGDVLTNEVSRKFWERNVSFHRLLSKQLWRGNPATGNAAGGGYKEMTGLQLLVNTGYVDADAGVACPAMDSYVRAFNYGRIDLATGAANLIATLTDMIYQLESRADRAGVSPVRFVLAMRPQLFYQITAIWPCSYLTTNCLTSSAGTPLNMDAQDVVRFRDEMRAGKYLLVDGKRYDVILDDGIIEYDGNSSGGNFPRGCFATDIYVLPMSMIGGQSTLYLEYFQYTNPSASDALGNMILGRAEGAFLTWPRQTNMCVQWQSRIEPRLVLRTPWLAGRISNVVYCPIQHERETFPEEPYFANGGRTSRTGPSYHSLWAA